MRPEEFAKLDRVLQAETLKQDILEQIESQIFTLAFNMKVLELEGFMPRDEVSEKVHKWMQEAMDKYEDYSRIDILKETVEKLMLIDPIGTIEEVMGGMR